MNFEEFAGLPATHGGVRRSGCPAAAQPTLIGPRWNGCRGFRL